MSPINEHDAHLPICATCGTQFPAPREDCPVCRDDRQYVGWDGQRWTTHAELAARFTLRIGEDAGLLAFAIDGKFAIPQRALLLRTGAGNILWECLSLVTDQAVAALHDFGGVDRIVISHPHFHSSMLAWSDALGGAEILLHGNDRQWIARPSPRIRLWHGDSLKLSDDVTLINTGGHFPGSTALHWTNGPHGGALFPGDAPQVADNRRRVGFMYSYPNYTPMAPSAVRRMRELLRPYAFEDVYGYSWGRNILGGGREAVDASFDDFLQRVAA